MITSKFYFIFSEPLHNLKQHKLRNLLTGFGILWGVMILILLLGGGEGLYQGAQKLFSGFTQNSIWLYGGRTSQTNKQEKEGKAIQFSKAFYKSLPDNFKEIEAISAELSYPQSCIFTYKEKHSTARLKAVYPDYFKIKNLPLSTGRYLNRLDIKEERKVCVIGDYLNESLFRGRDAIGKTLMIQGINYLVVGVLAKGNIFTQADQQAVFISVPSYENHFMPVEYFTTIGIVLKEGTNSDFVQEKLKPFLVRKLGFDKDDTSALYVMDTQEQRASFDKLFNGLKLFLWAIGLSLLISGVLGVGNMMLVAIKERTKELGIRKSLGASPKEILRMIMIESICITLFSGLAGIVFGYALMQVGNLFLIDGSEDSLMEAMQLNIPVLIGAIVLLIFSGAIAGLLPAQHAMSISAVDALNTES